MARSPFEHPAARMQIVAAAAVLKTFLMMVDLFVCFGKITSAFVNTSENESAYAGQTG